MVFDLFMTDTYAAVTSNGLISSIGLLRLSHSTAVQLTLRTGLITHTIRPKLYG